MVATQSRKQVINDFFLKYLELSDAKKRRVDLLFEVLKRARDTRERREISEAIQEIVDPALLDATSPIDPEHGIGEDAKNRVAAYQTHIGKVIRDRRVSLGLTQEELAQRSGLPQSHISRLESGLHTPTELTIEKLAKALDTTPDRLDLLYGS